MFHLHFIAVDIYGVLWNKLLKKEIIYKNHIKFNKNLRQQEDLPFIYEVLNFSKKLSHIESPLYYYNKTNEMSLTGKYRPELIVDRFRVKRIINNLEKNKNLRKKNQKFLCKDEEIKELFYE